MGKVLESVCDRLGLQIHRRSIHGVSSTEYRRSDVMILPSVPVPCLRWEEYRIVFRILVC